MGQVLDSKANLNSYCLEVAKQLNMHYKAPPLPVDLQYAKAPEAPKNRDGSDALDTEALTQAFRSAARNKHNIRVC